MKDTFDKFAPPERGRFGDNEMSPTREARADLVDLDLILHNDNPAKKAIAVSPHRDTPFESWVWLPRSLIEYEAMGMGTGLRVTLPKRLAKEKGLI